MDWRGQPVSSADLAKPPPLRRTSRAAPTFDPTPEKLGSLYKKADQGDPRELQQLLSDIESRDGHFGGVLETRRRAITRLPWRAVALTDDKADVAVADAVQRDILDARWFRPTVRALLDAVLKGWSACSITWATGDVWRPVDVRWVDQQMTAVTPEDDQRIAWRDPADETKLQPILPYTAIVHAASDPSGPLHRRGIGRSLSMLYSLKRLGLQSWASFVELFGVARPVATYAPNTKESDVDQFVSMLENWVHGGYLIKPAGLMVEFPEPGSAGRGGGGDPVHAQLAKYCDEQASKRIIGQTMTSDSGSSRSQSEVHERVAAWITEADLADLAETIMRDLVGPYVALNFGPDVPVPVVGALIEYNERRAFQVDSIVKLTPFGFRVEQSFVRDLLGVPEPAEDAEVLTPEASTSAAAGSTGTTGASRRQAELVRMGMQPRVARDLLRRAERQAFARAGSDEDVVDRDAGEAAGDNWRRDLQPFVAAAEKAAAGADSYREFTKRLRAQVVDGDQLVRDLAITTMGLRGVGDGTDDT